MPPSKLSLFFAPQDPSDSPVMTADHDQFPESNQKKAFSSKLPYRKWDGCCGNDHRPQWKIAGLKRKKSPKNTGKRAPYRHQDNQPGAGNRHAFSALSLTPEGEIMPEHAAKS